MSAWLVIQIAAPLASFGELAGTVRRGGSDRPGKGALLGLLGAALGVRRDDAPRQKALAEGYAVATRVWRSGRILQDFHTYESVAASTRERYYTRADALARGKPTTSITRREYRMDVLVDAAYRARDAAPWSLKELQEALLRPAFTLSLGRKACPLSAPLNPLIVPGDWAADAFDAADVERPEAWRKALSSWRDQRSENHLPQMIAEEEADANARGANHGRVERRYDQPKDRVGWHFERRAERVWKPSEQTPSTDAGETENG